MPNVMTPLPNIGGILCEGSIIPFLVPRRKLWLMPMLKCHTAMLPIWENARVGRKVNFVAGKIPLGGKSPQNAYIVHKCRIMPNIVQSLVDLS